MATFDSNCRKKISDWPTSPIDDREELRRTFVENYFSKEIEGGYILWRQFDKIYSEDNDRRKTLNQALKLLENPPGISRLSLVSRINAVENLIFDGCKPPSNLLSRFFTAQWIERNDKEYFSKYIVSMVRECEKNEFEYSDGITPDFANQRIEKRLKQLIASPNKTIKDDCHFEIELFIRYLNGPQAVELLDKLYGCSLDRSDPQLIYGHFHKLGLSIAATANGDSSDHLVDYLISRLDEAKKLRRSDLVSLVSRSLSLTLPKIQNEEGIQLITKKFARRIFEENDPIYQVLLPDLANNPKFTNLKICEKAGEMMMNQWKKNIKNSGLIAISARCFSTLDVEKRNKLAREFFEIISEKLDQTFEQESAMEIRHLKNWLLPQQQERALNYVYMATIRSKPQLIARRAQFLRRDFNKQLTKSQLEQILSRLQHARIALVDSKRVIPVVPAFLDKEIVAFKDAIDLRIK